MSETQLNREFEERDIQRMRNIISGNTADRTRVQVGYEKKTVTYTEGDVWEEKGKVWTIKDGLKQTVTKHDAIRKAYVMPLKCPSCKKAMKTTSLNKKMWNFHKKCFDCVIEMETQLKIEGKYEQYAKDLMNANKDSFVKDYEQAVEEYSNAKDDTFMSEAGDVETWSAGKVTPEVINALKANIKQLKHLF